ncbi:hypothetical protein CI238_03335, partial [Colletotrichum incanum]
RNIANFVRTRSPNHPTQTHSQRSSPRRPQRSTPASLRDLRFDKRYPRWPPHALSTLLFSRTTSPCSALSLRRALLLSWASTVR